MAVPALALRSVLLLLMCTLSAAILGFKRTPPARPPHNPDQCEWANLPSLPPQQRDHCLLLCSLAFVS